MNQRCDVLIVGGGIAGLATAERLAREGARRGTPLDILVLESDGELGTGASGRLEGWYHSGALYSSFDDDACFHSSMASRALLRNDYALASDFSARESCNIDRRADRANPAWFHEPIDYLLPSSTLNPANPPTRQVRMVERLSGEIEREAIALRADAPAPTPDLGVHRLPSLDRVMDSQRIMRDLAEAAWARGTRFQTGAQVLAIDSTSSPSHPHEATVSIDGATPVLIGARLAIVTAGPSLAPDGRLGSLAPERARIVTRRSVMVVTGTPLSTSSFVYVGEDNSQDFSHLLHPTPTGAYSVIADSNSLGANADEQHACAEALLRKAERFFGPDVWRDRAHHAYACAKVEAASSGSRPPLTPWVNSTDERSPICVLPGKFSFFPLMAQAVTERCIARGLFDLADTRTTPGDAGPKPIVAQAYARQLACVPTPAVRPIAFPSTVRATHEREANTRVHIR